MEKVKSSHFFYPLLPGPIMGPFPFFTLDVIVPERNGMTLKQNAVIRVIHNDRKWTDMLVTGQAANLTNLAKKLGLAAPYVTRILGLVNLAPDIVEAVCSGSEPEGVSLAHLVKGFPDDWEEQRMVMGFQNQ